MHPLDERKSANELYPVWTNINHLNMTNKHKTAMLMGQRPLDCSRMIRRGGIELESRRPSESVAISDHNKRDAKTVTRGASVLSRLKTASRLVTRLGMF